MTATQPPGVPASSTPAGASASPAPPRSTDWTTYNRSNDRNGLAEGVQPPQQPSPAWRARLDGAVYGQPLVLGDLAIAATEHDSVYGLDLATGAVRWRRSLGTPAPLRDLPCGNIDPLGITGTPAYDPVTGSVFVVTETTDARHTLVALEARTGAVRFSRDVDLAGRDRHAEQQRGALAVAGGRVYIPFGGLAGDCGNYVGYVVALDVLGAGRSAYYAVPTAREGGIWAPSGVAIGPARRASAAAASASSAGGGSAGGGSAGGGSAGGDVWVAVGNGASVDEPYDGSDSVLRLAADLSRRLDFFAPRDWGSQNAADADLGSTGPLLFGPDRVLISGKDGGVYLLDAAHLGGIGGQLDRIGDCHGFGGMAADVRAGVAFVPCDEGLLQVRVGARTLQAGWRAAGNVNGSPVIGGGAVWSLDHGAGRLHVLDADTGAQLGEVSVGTVSRFAAPVLSGRWVLVPTMTGITALSLGEPR